MMESYAYELIKKEGYEEGVLAGIQQGIQQGMQQGIQQGMQQGIQQGMQQGVQQGTLQATRELILETLQARFEDVPGIVFAALSKIENTEALKLLFRKALRAHSLEDFQKSLENFLH